jgi:aspartate/methionine/tyrosine aminotransferase
VLTRFPPILPFLTANEYAPIAGIKKLREKVAELYNKRYRVGKASQYTFENICIVPGGRAALTRLAAAVGGGFPSSFSFFFFFYLLPLNFSSSSDVYVGFFLPDYTAYEEMLSIFKRLVPIPNALKAKNRYQIHPKKLRHEVKFLPFSLLLIHSCSLLLQIAEKGLSVILESNPCNPTGQVIQGEELKQRIDCARENHCTLILDEFYSSYIYTHPPEEGNYHPCISFLLFINPLLLCLMCFSPLISHPPPAHTVSSALYVEDVNVDPVIIVDGMTKNWRVPGWRICWIVGPKPLVESVSAAGSFLEGGANHP